jgi:flavodoxin/Fe-S-cluster-containing hydrogenase component 2
MVGWLLGLRLDETLRRKWKIAKQRSKMKSIVIYFSQTGNTRQIAQAIWKGMKEAGEQCDLARIQDVKTEDLANYDLIGLGSPVWHRREPLNVLNFIEYKLRSLEGKLGFIFCTHGLYPGHFIGRVVSALSLEGIRVLGWKNWYCSAWVPEHPKPYFTDGHPDEIDLEEARCFGHEMAVKSQAAAAGNISLPVLPQGSKYHELYPGPGSTDRIHAFREKDDSGYKETRELIDLRSFDFRVNQEKCLYPKCTVCIDNCPMQSINFSVSPIVFRKNCERCWFCEQICPRAAIEVDWAPVAAFVDKYIVNDWFKAAEQAVARGQLRMLVKPENIGRNTYWYTFNKPRLKVPGK